MYNRMKKHVFSATFAIANVLGQAAWAECGDLCDIFWWKWADVSDVRDLLDTGFDVNGHMLRIVFLTFF